MNNPIATRIVTVTGQGSSSAAPDLFQINIGIEAQRGTVREAYAAASEALNAVQQKLTQHNVSADSMSSTALDVRAETRWQEGAGSIVTGYTVSSTLNVVFRYADGGENVIAAVVDAGNNAVRLNGLTPVVADASAATDKAREDAFANARRAANLYAKAAGTALGNVVSISETNSFSGGGPVPVMAGGAAMFDSAMKIEPGQSTLSATVTVTFELI